MRCGRNLVRAFLEYYRSTGAIPIEITTEVSNKKKKHRSSRLRQKNKNHTRNRSPVSGRVQAQLHFKNLNMTYDSETSVEECTYSYRSGSPRKLFDKISQQYNLKTTHTAKQWQNYRSDSPIPVKYLVIPEPNLTVIDFNVISREGIDKVSNLNKVKKSS